MHYLDAKKAAGEEARRQLQKNAASNIEQVLEVTTHKAPTIRPPASHHENYIYLLRRTRHAGLCWRSKDELLRDVLLWTHTYGRAKSRRPARTYIQQPCEDTGCSPEDLPEAMNDRERWRERAWDICASGTTWWWWWWCLSSEILSLTLKVIYIYIYVAAIASLSILLPTVPLIHSNIARCLVDICP